MGCPFELPVEKVQMPKNSKGIKLYRIDKVYFPYTEDEANYIVQAINSYEKSKTTLEEIEAVSCGEKQIECDGVYNDSDGLLWIYKRIQALKRNHNERSRQSI